MAEYKTIHKVLFVWDFEKEEHWLNEMALTGWALASVGLFKYTFERCEPGEYTVRLEMHNPDKDYLHFMREAGAEYIGRIVQWIYFRKKSVDGPFDIFSDVDSKIQHLDKIGKMLFVIGGLNLMIGIINTFSPTRLGIINLLCATLLMYALGRIHGKKEALKKDRQLHE